MDGLPDLSADPGRLRQVFSNLLDNAIRHTPPGGEIVVSSAIDGEHIILTIRDSGEGVAPEQLPYLFTASTAPTHLVLEIRAAAGWVWPLFRHW